MKNFLLTIVMLFAIFFLFGCLNPVPPGDSHIGSPVPFGPEWLDSMIEVAKAFTIANTTSAPVNPFVLPIGIGLAGLTAVLEALRRTEKSGRKYAEHELKANGSGNSKPV